jgi:hypothetical protein
MNFVLNYLESTIKNSEWRIIKKFFESHKTNKTLPEMIHYTKCAKPFLWDDQIAVDMHNQAIRLFQNSILNNNIIRLEQIISSLDEDLNEIKKQLANFKGDKETFIENIKNSAQESLRKDIEASNSKLLRLNAIEIEDLFCERI